MLAHLALRLIHFLYVAFVAIAASLRRCKWKRPKPLKAYRSKIPKHLCLNLVADSDMSVEVTEAAFLQCLESVASWCRELGIETLTAYDRHGIFYRCAESAHKRVFLSGAAEESCESEVEYPLTPPPSESSGSRSHSPEHAALPVDLHVIMMMHQSGLRRRRNVAVRRHPKSNDAPSPSGNLTLRIASRSSGKPAIVSACQSLLQSCVGGNLMTNNQVPSKPAYKLSVPKLAMVLEGKAGLPPPDFMIIHHLGGMKASHPPMELHGFPPWQSTLTEFHRTHPDDGSKLVSFGSRSVCAPELISETAFRRALDEYATAQFRLGR